MYIISIHIHTYYHKQGLKGNVCQIYIYNNYIYFNNYVFFFVFFIYLF